MLPQNTDHNHNFRAGIDSPQPPSPFATQHDAPQSLCLGPPSRPDGLSYPMPFSALIYAAPRPPQGSWAHLPHYGWFVTSLVPRAVMADLAGVFGAQARGEGDTRAVLFALDRLLFPSKFDAYGNSCPLVLVPTPPMSKFATSTDINGRTTPRPLMSEAFEVVERWAAAAGGTDAASASGLAPSRVSGFWVAAHCQANCLRAFGHAAVVVVPTTPASFLASALERVRADSVANLSPERRLMEAHTLVTCDRACAAHEAIAKAIAQAALLYQSSGVGMTVAFAGHKMARCVALTDTIVAVELHKHKRQEGSDFAIVTSLPDFFTEELWDHMPHQLVDLGAVDDEGVDLMARAVAEKRTFRSSVHFEQILDILATQRLLDLFAASQMCLGTQSRGLHLDRAESPATLGPLHSHILQSARNHRPPQYFFPSPCPEAPLPPGIAAQWALQLATVTIAELPPNLFDTLLLELVGGNRPGEAAAALPTPVNTAPNTTAVQNIVLPSAGAVPLADVDEDDPFAFVATPSDEDDKDSETVDLRPHVEVLRQPTKRKRQSNTEDNSLPRFPTNLSLGPTPRVTLRPPTGDTANEEREERPTKKGRAPKAKPRAPRGSSRGRRRGSRGGSRGPSHRTVAEALLAAPNATSSAHGAIQGYEYEYDQSRATGGSKVPRLRPVVSTASSWPTQTHMQLPMPPPGQPPPYHLHYNPEQNRSPTDSATPGPESGDPRNPYMTGGGRGAPDDSPLLGLGFGPGTMLHPRSSDASPSPALPQGGGERSGPLSVAFGGIGGSSLGLHDGGGGGAVGSSNGGGGDYNRGSYGYH